MEHDSKRKDRLKEITDSLEAGIKDLFQSEKYAEYLRTMSRFHQYSLNNTILIAMQRPDATLVAGYNKWRDQFKRNVKRGEKGIKIIAPTPFKKIVEEAKLDPNTKLPMLNAGGDVVMEEKEIKIPMYKIVTVFDISQTEGEPILTELASVLDGNVRNYNAFVEALKRSAPVPISIIPLETNMDGYFDSEHQSIAIREGMSEVQTVSAVIHEIAHSRLHNKELPEVKEQWKVVMVSDGGIKKDFTGGFDTRAEAETEAETRGWVYVDENRFEWHLEIEEDTYIAEFVQKSRSTEEVEAESVSYAVCAYYGIPTGENSFGYIASWSKNKELPELKASLETIQGTASNLIGEIDRNIEDIKRIHAEFQVESKPTMDTEKIDMFDTTRRDTFKDFTAGQVFNQAEQETHITEKENGPSVAELEAQVKAGKPISLMDLAYATRRGSKNHGQGKAKTRDERMER